MAKPAGKKQKNSVFMKPMQPSEHLAKVVGDKPLPRTEVTMSNVEQFSRLKLPRIG